MDPILSLALSVFVTVCVLGLLWWAFRRLAGAFGFPPALVVLVEALGALLTAAWLLRLAHVWTW